MKARRAGKLLLGGLCYAMGHFAYWRFVAFSRELRYILFKGGIVMDDVTRQALDNAAASSAIEGLPLSESDFKILDDIMEGRTTLQDYLKQLKAESQEA